jgi:DNA polymerase-3 subunit delta'
MPLTTGDDVFQQLLGQPAVVAQLRRAIERRRLAHAYLFLGPEGVGKHLCARLFVQALFCRLSLGESLRACGECPCCRQVRSGAHPDLLHLGLPEGKRELPIELLVGPPERRGREGLCHDLSLRPMQAPRRAAIIDDAHTMNEESANALLKTLEEPPPGSVLILIATDQELLLPTIRSRCQPVLFAPLSCSDLQTLLLQSGAAASPDEAAAAARMAQGSLAVARRLLDPGLQSLRDVLLQGLSVAPLQRFLLTAQVTEALDSLEKDPSGQRRNAGWAVQFAADFYRERLRQGRAAAPEFLDRASAALERCLDAGDHLQQSMPVPLCLAGLFDDLARIEHTGRAAELGPLG